jgi:hypothetical protein
MSYLPRALQAQLLRLVFPLLLLLPLYKNHKSDFELSGTLGMDVQLVCDYQSLLRPDQGIVVALQ